MNFENATEFPFEIKVVKSKNDDDLKKYYFENTSGFVEVNGYILPKKYEKYAECIYNFKVRPDDVWVVTFPRSGTTLTQELVWLTANNLNYDLASEINLNKRFPFFESNVMFDDNIVGKLVKDSEGDENENSLFNSFLTAKNWEVLNEMPSPRFIKTHLPFSLLPPNLLTSGAKVVCVIRNPKSVIVSYYKHSKDVITRQFIGDFKKFWEYFRGEKNVYGSYFKRIEEFLRHKDNPNVLIYFYEEMVVNMPAVIEKVSTFFNKSYSEEERNKLANHLHIDNFKNNPSVNSEQLMKSGFTKEFIRKGKVDGWCEKFTPELEAEADKWILENIVNLKIDLPYLK